jgi:hypothetical protein
MDELFYTYLMAYHQFPALRLLVWSGVIGLVYLLAT